MSRAGTRRVLVSRPATAAAWYLVAGKTCVAAYQPKGAASLALSYVNLANPGTYDAAPGTAPTFNAATGWTFDGGTQYLTIGIVMLAGWSYIVRVSDSSNTSGRVVGAADGGYVGINNIVPYATAASWELRLGGSTKTCNQDGRNAVLCGAGNRAYHNGIDVGGVTPSTYSSKPLFIGALSLDGTPVFHFAGKVQAFAAYSATLTAGEVATLSTAIAAL